MITSLELTQFRGYRSLQLELAPVNVIFGSNGSGKSSVLSALSIFTAGLDIAAREARRQETGHQLVQGQPLAGLAAASGGWKNIFTRTDTSSATHLAVEGTYDGEGWIEKGRLTADVAHVPAADVAVEVEAYFSRTRLPQYGRHASATMIVHVSTLPMVETYLSNAEFEAAAHSGAQGAGVRNNLIRLGDVSIERLNRTLGILSNAEIVSRTSLADAQDGAPLAVHFRRDGSTFEIGLANHGLVSTLALLSGVEAYLAGPTATGERLLLLDEPELHLHPLAQASIADHLVKASRVAKAQIVFVTHSDHIIRHLMPHTDSVIVNIEQRFRRLRRIHSQKDLLNALEETRDLAPYAAVNFLSSRRVLFVEGQTDETILQRCALGYFAGSPDRLALFETWTLVPLGGVSNAPAASLIERLVSSTILPNLKRDEVMMVASVLDRDYDKEPCHRIHSGRQVVRVEHIWSRHSIESLFVDEDTLNSLLLVALGASTPSDMADRVRAAIGAADIDDGLREHAEDELAEFFRRTRQFNGKAAQVEAREHVRANPKVWQHGKDRAEFVLRHVRNTLPVSLQNRVRASISKILEAIPAEELDRIQVPVEIIVVFDELVALSTEFRRQASNRSPVS